MIRRWKLWRLRRRKLAAPDWCSVCLCDLVRGNVWEVREEHQDADDGQPGGSFLVRTYCRRHKPKGAVRT